MNRKRWKELTEQAMKAREEYPQTVYVHIVVLPGGAIFTVTPTQDRADGRKKVYPKLSPWGLKIGDFDEVISGSYGGTITTWFLPKKELLDETDQVDPTDPLTFDDMDEPHFYGMTDIPGYDYDEEASFNTGESEFADAPVE